MGTRIIHTASGSKLERGNKMDEQTIKLQCMDRAIATLASNPVVTKVLPLAKEFYAWVSDSKTNTLYFENVSTERKKD